MSFSLCSHCGWGYPWIGYLETWLVLALLGIVPAYLIARARMGLHEL